jgi:hypothetical protein
MKKDVYIYKIFIEYTHFNFYNIINLINTRRWSKKGSLSSESTPTQ